MVSLTPLAIIPAFTNAIRLQLAPYWITSAEEFASIAKSAPRRRYTLARHVAATGCRHERRDNGRGRDAP
jgi:hypothetical protein